MKLAALCLGACMVGFVLPEFLVILSAKQVRSPTPLNFLSALGFALLAYGVAA
jgi:type II secretory pathway component PulF